MWPEPITRHMTFELRGATGTVELTYSRNDEPTRWGYDLLGLDWDFGVAAEFPVIEGRVRFPRRGYAGVLGWVQAVDYVVHHDDGRDEAVVVTPDVAPQLREADTPYLAVGIEPQLFDAPAFTERNVDWNAPRVPHLHARLPDDAGRRAALRLLLGLRDRGRRRDA